MQTVTRPPDKTADPLPPLDITPYFGRRIALYRWVYAQAAPQRGLPPEPWPA